MKGLIFSMKIKYRAKKHRDLGLEVFDVSNYKTTMKTTNRNESENEKVNKKISETSYDNDKPSLVYCPECGHRLIEVPMDVIQHEGVGPAYLQHMRSWSVATEIVCPNCGMVIGKSVRRIHR